MQRFGYFQYEENGAYSESGDRYGFGACLSSRDDYPIQKKPTFRINVSSTGKVEEKVLPPLNKIEFSSNPNSPEKSNLNKAITIRDLERAFELPQLKDYKELGWALISALLEKTVPLPKKPIQLPSYLRETPFFIGSTPNPQNTSIFNGYNIHISIFLSAEDRQRNVTDIAPFGQNYYDLPITPVTFMIYSSDKDHDFLGKAYGNLVSHRDAPWVERTIIRIHQIEDFAKNKITWLDLPVGCNLISTLNINNTSVLVHPSTITLKDIRDEDLPTVEGDFELGLPHFKGHPPSNDNYIRRISDGHYTVHLKFITYPLTPISLPGIKEDGNKDVLISLQDKSGIVQGYVEGTFKEGWIIPGRLLDLDHNPIEWNAMEIASVTIEFSTV